MSYTQGLIPPPLTGWTWVNQGDNTTLDGLRSVGTYSPAGNGLSSVDRYRYRATPGGAFRLTAKLEIAVRTNSFGGLYFTDNSNHVVFMGTYTDQIYTGAPHFGINTQAPIVGTSQAFNQCKWFRLRDTGTNIVGLFSFDENPSLTTDDGWIQIYSATYAALSLSGAPTRMGFGMNPFNTSGNAALVVVNHLDIDGKAVS